MAANTSILIKRSVANSQPLALAAGELAYSYLSNTIFIGSPSGTGVINIGGYYYTSQVDAATSANTAGTLVKRDANNGFFGALYGNANTASALLNAQNFSINGDDVDSGTVSFDGTGAVVLQGNLKTTGVVAGTYGGSTEIPVFTVDSKGRLSSAANVSVATTLAFGGDTGTANLSLLTDTLTIAGREGITTLAVDANNTVLIDVDNTVVRSNTIMSKQLIDGDVEISGNLTVIGTETIINVQTLNVADPLLYLAGNNYTSDVVDIGFVGNYFDGSTSRHTGVFRHAGTKEFYVFDNYDQEPSNNVIDVANASFRIATLNANLTANTGNIATLYVANRIYGDTTNNSLILAPSTSYGPGVNDQYIVLDPSVPNHIHVRAGGTIDASNAELFFGGENTGVQVSDSAKETYVRANTHTWTFTDAGRLALPNGNEFYDDATGIYVTTVRSDATPTEVLFYNNTTKEITRGSLADLNPDSIANGSFSLSIAGSDGKLTFNGAGIELANGAFIKDTSGDAVAFGQNAGTLSQGSQAVAIGDSAGYNTQGTYAVAIGYGAGNISQGQQAVAIGINAGISNQGIYGVAIGSSAGSNQGSGAIAVGYDSGGVAGADSIALGTQAGKGNTSAMGANTIAIGRRAGYESAFAGSIILNASGNDLSSLAAGLYIDPVRYTATQDATYDGIMFYNSSTKEIRYSYALDGGTF